MLAGFTEDDLRLAGEVATAIALMAWIAIKQTYRVGFLAGFRRGFGARKEAADWQ